MDTNDHTQAGAFSFDKSTAEKAKQTRVRSRIEFPYTDLGQAEELVRTLYHQAGGSAEPDQLASWMNQTATGGTFRARLSAARLFGLVETERGAVTITSLGKDVADEDRRAAARVGAFLNIPLFAAMYERLKNYPLPPAAAIERQMQELGVPEKQKERARQAFQKSANIAQFVDPGTGRFVKPAVKDVPPDASDDEDNDRGTGSGDGGGGGGGGGGGDQFHPFIRGLLDELPDDFSSWEIEDQAEWLRAAAVIFKLLSKQKGEIAISLKKEETAARGEAAV